MFVCMFSCGQGDSACYTAYIDMLILFRSIHSFCIKKTNMFGQCLVLRCMALSQHPVSW